MGLSGAPGKGFTGTGIARVPDGWWIANHGKQQESDSTYASSLVHLSSGFSISQEIPLSTLFPNIGSVQGIAFDGTLWLADMAGHAIRHISTGGTPLEGISLPYSPNGVALYPKLHAIWILQDAAQGKALELRRLSDGEPLARTTNNLPARDHLYFDEPNHILLISYGKNRTPGRIRVYAVTGTALQDLGYFLVPRADAIEGIAWIGTHLYVVNDAGYHNGNPAENRLLTYQVPALNSLKK